jgi:hypothetical protein
MDIIVKFRKDLNLQIENFDIMSRFAILLHHQCAIVGMNFALETAMG